MQAKVKEYTQDLLSDDISEVRTSFLFFRQHPDVLTRETLVNLILAGKKFNVILGEEILNWFRDEIRRRAATFSINDILLCLGAFKVYQLPASEENIGKSPPLARPEDAQLDQT